MSPDTAIALVKKYAKQHGVREAARIFHLAPGTVSYVLNNKGKISGKRIAAKVAVAGTFTCPALEVLMLPEVCLKLRADVERLGWHGLKREIRRTYGFCPSCKIGKDLCQEK